LLEGQQVLLEHLEKGGFLRQELDKLHIGLDRTETRSASSRNGTLTAVLLSK
jgi:hypothetical protein